MSTNSPSRFYGGIHIGSVAKLSPTSWAQFVKETLGHPAILNVTREQFQAMDKKQRNAAKRVRYVTPATFKASHRVYENAVDIALLALDIDDPKQAAPFVKTPSLLREALSPLAFAAYTTASSTPSEPKLRVLVPASHFPVKHYIGAVRTLAARIGLPNVTKESLVSVQPMYLPTLFRGDDTIDAHPLISALTEGEVFTPEMIEGSGAPTATSEEPDQGDMSEGLEHLRSQVEDVTEDDAKEALKHLDPDCSMADWIVVACALRHQFGQDTGFRLWDEWSAKGKKYDGPKDSAKRWKHIKPTPRGRAPVTIRTLFMRATENGWKGYAGVSQKIYQKTLAWLQDKNRTEAELLAEGVRRIASCGFQSSVDKSALLSHLKQAFHRVGVKPSAVALRREVQKIERSSDRPKASVKAQDEAELPKWARGMCFVSRPDEFFQRASDSHFNPEVLDRVYGRYLTSPGDESGRPYIRPRDFLLNVAKIPTVDNYLYDPTHPEETFVERDGKRFVNTYLPTYPEPDGDRAAEAQDVFEAHLGKLIAEPEYRAIALDFLAYTVQHPGEKIRWAWLQQGAQGCGKTAIAEMMRAVLGPSNATVLDASLLFTPFNGWATGSQLVSMEEIRVVGHNRHEVMNRLKPCISNDTVVINRKNRDLQQVPNNTNYIMFTNHHDSLAVTEEDRRYFVVNSAMQTKADVRALGPKYFTRLFSCIRNNAGGLRHWLENHKVSAEFNPSGHAPQTKYLRDLAGASATPLTAAVKDALEDKSNPLVQPDLMSTRALKLMISGENLPRFSDQQLAVALRELDYVQVCRARIGPDGERHSLWVPRSKQMSDANATKAAERRLSGKENPSLL
jgi:hypothetical protein